MKKPEALSEEEKTRKLADSAFYKRSKTPKSQMIMIKVLQANKLDNLRRTNKIAALAYFVEPDSKDLEIDYDLVEVIYSVSNALIATKKTAHYANNWRYWIYPISWGFPLTLETYKKYIDPWMENYEFLKLFEINYERYLYKETRAFCPYCKDEILNINQVTKEDAIKQLKNKYKESYEEIEEALIDEQEVKKRHAKAMSLARYDYFDYYYRYKYKPPSWKGTYINCPKCKEKIRLTFKFFEGSYAKHFAPVEPPELELKEIIIENREYYDPVTQLMKFKNISNFFTHKGYNQLINGFLAWAEPSVSHIEWEILKLVDPDTLQKYLDLEFKSEEKEEQGEEEQ